MSYQALYRKWRPQTFEDIVGQQAVSQTLRNAIVAKKMAHAYLFTGPRGTGKTSAAKILAKAMNCPHNANGEPCNHCEICQGITEGTIGDVIEIDAASNNGVDEIRDIRDKARYAPTQVQYKVYIIDEVHMLSTGAFNALLKTLEEPPLNVIFILATTEVYKIPATVISRTQRFDFKRITEQEIRERLHYILDREQITFEPETLDIIARTANGGMRDALSILDQIISFSEGKLTIETTQQLTGVLSDTQKIEYISALSQGDTNKALEVLRAILSAGQEAHRFIEEILLFTRDLLLAKETSNPTASDLLHSHDAHFFDLAASVSLSFLYRIVTEYQETERDIRFSLQAPIYLEVSTIKLAVNSPVENTLTLEPSRRDQTDLEREVQLLRQQVSDLQQASENPSSLSIEKQPEKREVPKVAKRQKTTAFKPNLTLIYQTLAEATQTDRNRIVAVWETMIHQLPNFQQALLNQTQPVAASENSFILAFDYEILCQRVDEDKAVQQAVAQMIQSQTGHPGRMLVLTTAQWQQARQEYVTALHNGQQDQLLRSAGGMPTHEEQAAEHVPPVDDNILSEQESDDFQKPIVDLFGIENVTIVDEEK